MKRILYLLLAAFLWAASPPAQVAPPTNLVVRQTNGDTLFPLEKIASVTFPETGGAVVTLTDNQSTSFTSPAFLSVRFNQNHYNSVEELTIERGVLLYENLQLLAPGRRISVYNAQGMQVVSGDDMIDTSILPAGLYIAVSGETSLKFVRP